MRLQNWPESCLGSGEDDDEVPAGLLRGPDVDPEGRLGLLEPLDLQRPLVPIGRLHSLDLHLGLGPGLLKLLDQGLFVS